MKKHYLPFIAFASFALASCEDITKDMIIQDPTVNDLKSSKETYNDALFEGTVPAYDAFFDAMDAEFTASPLLPSSPDAWNLCGYSSNNRWGRLSWDWSCPLDPNLASLSGGFLNLQVPGNLQKIGGQIETVRNDYWYGSYRFKVKAGAHSGDATQGTCNGIFFYNSDTQEEIDIEILTNEHADKKVHFVTHPGFNGITHSMSSDPTENYIEYGFDWYSNKIDFFVEGVKVKTQTLAVPVSKGKLILNHWTGIPGWGGTPPPSASNMSVDHVWHSPFLLVTSPDQSGTVWAKGATKTITWNRYGDAIASSVKIELWKEGVFYKTIKSTAPNTGSYIWKIPSSYPTSSKYQIKIKSSLNSNYFDFSNSGFTIQ